MRAPPCQALGADTSTQAIIDLADVIGTGEPVSDELGEHALRILADGMHADAVVVVKRSSERYLVARAYDPHSTGVTLGHWLTLHDQAFQDAEVDSDVDLGSHRSFVVSLLLDAPAGVRSSVGIPLFGSDGRAYGRLLCLSSNYHAPSYQELALLRLAGRIMMQVIERAELARGDEEYRALLERSSDSILVVRQGIIVYANPAARTAAKDLGLEAAAGRPLHAVLSPDATLLSRNRLAFIEQASTPLMPITFELDRGDGSPHAVEAVPLPVVYGGLSAVQIQMRFVSEDDVSKDEWQRRALHDPLTGLPNRALLEDRLTQAIRVAERERDCVAVLLMDLDGFKQINDAFGHDAGDRVLRSSAPRLRRLLRESDTVARLGGDEFAFVLPGADVSDAEGVARKILAAIRRSYFVGGERVSLWASIGVAVSPDHGSDASILLHHADDAMYRVKRREGGVSVYAPTVTSLPSPADGGRRSTNTLSGE